MAAEFGDEREVESDVVLSYHLETGRMNLILELLPGHAVDMAEIVDRLAVYGLGQASRPGRKPSKRAVSSIVE